MNSPTKDRFGYDNNVSLQTDDVGHVGAAVRRNRKGFTSLDMGFLPEKFLPAICRQKRQIFRYVLCIVPKC